MSQRARQRRGTHKNEKRTQLFEQGVDKVEYGKNDERFRNHDKSPSNVFDRKLLVEKQDETVARSRKSSGIKLDQIYLPLRTL